MSSIRPDACGGDPGSQLSTSALLCPVIDPEVALKACQEVLLQVQLQSREAPEQQAQAGPRWSIREEEEEPQERPPAPSSSKQSWLLRLFESKLFDVSMAISYLYKSKEPGVQAYIGNRLFSFPDGEVDFYLPQLLNMYVHMDTEVGDAIRPYLVSLPPRSPPRRPATLGPSPLPVLQVHRCRGSIAFSLLTAWLLGAYSSDMHISTQRHSRGTRLRRLILSDHLNPDSTTDSPASSPSSRRGHRRQRSSNLDTAPPTAPDCPLPGEGEVFASPSKKTHQRSKSDATTAGSTPPAGLRRTGSNPKVEAVHDEVRRLLIGCLLLGACPDQAPAFSA